jgi:glycosyltransferase involved in cell wall biosynthesis
MIPFWPSNPYQPMLVSALRDLGIEVETARSLKDLTRDPELATRGSVVHLHWLPTAEARADGLARWWLFGRRIERLKQRGLALVWTAHNLVPHESRIRAMDRWLSRKVAAAADRIVCHSHTARHDLADELRIVDLEKVRVIPHGHYIGAYPHDLTREECRQLLNLDRDAVVFLSIGLIRSYKGTIELAEAFGQVRKHDARLLIVGKPLDHAVDASLKKLASLDSRIRYVPGYVPDDALQLYFNAADAVVFPYRRSLTSGALILAMSFGRACIAPRLPGMVDCLGERGGILYDAGRKDGLFEALAVATARPETLREMGDTNLEQARAWDWRTVAEATAECYDRAVDAAE